MNGGLDFHGYGNVCSIWNAFYIPNWKSLTPIDKEKAIIQIIKNHKQNKLKVLVYKDRPFYDTESLFLSPIFTLFYYFRTLNFWQILSWIFWIILFVIIKSQINVHHELRTKFSINKSLPFISFLGSIFLIVLGFVYNYKIKDIVGFTKMYDEYSTVLFYVGFSLFFYSAIVLAVRKKTKI